MIKSVFASLILLSAGMLTAHATSDGISLKGVDGQQHTLADYTGKDQWVVVNVWSTACKFCRHELPDLVDFHEAHKDQDAMVLGIAIDLETFGYPDEETVRNFVLDYFVDFPNLFASADQAAELIGKPISSIPISFFFNPQGELIGQWNGIIKREELEQIIRTSPVDKGQLGTGEKSSRQPHQE